MIRQERADYPPAPLELALVSERAVYTMSHDRELTENNKVVLGQVLRFLEGVLRGQEGVKEFQFGKTSTRDIRTYQWGLSTYATLAKKRQEIEERDLKQVFTDYKTSVLEWLSRGTVGQEARSELYDFFQTMLEVTSQACSRPVQSCKVGPEV